MLPVLANDDYSEASSLEVQTPERGFNPHNSSEASSFQMVVMLTKAEAGALSDGA